MSQFWLWWLLSSVRDSELQYLLRDFYQEQGTSPDSPSAWSLRSFLLMEHGAQTGSQAAWPLCCSERAVASRLPKVLLVREAGGGGLANSVTPGQPGWAVSYVQFTTEKDGG